MKKTDIFIRLGFLVLLILVISLTNENFIKLENLINILRQGANLYILGIGMTYVILTGGLDLSIGANIALSSCVFAIMVQNGVPIIVGVIIAVIIGIVVGALNGIIVTFLKVPPFIATYAIMFIARGIAYAILSGSIIYGFEEKFRFIGTGSFFGMPMPIIISFLFLLIFLIILSNTPFGINVYAIGSNEESSRLAGIKVEKTIILVYLLSGFLASVAGLIYIARLNAAEPVVGEGFELKTIAAVLIGGVSLEGGRGSLLGTGIGVLIITVITNGLNLFGVPTVWQTVVIGSVILVLIILKFFINWLNSKRIFLLSSIKNK